MIEEQEEARQRRKLLRENEREKRRRGHGVSQQKLPPENQYFPESLKGPEQYQGGIVPYSNQPQWQPEPHYPQEQRQPPLEEQSFYSPPQVHAMKPARTHLSSLLNGIGELDARGQQSLDQAKKEHQRRLLLQQ